MTDASNFPKVPIAARAIGLPIRGTLILILWQRAFAWPQWIYGVLWTLLAFVWIAAAHSLWTTRYISDERWRSVFK